MYKNWWLPPDEVIVVTKKKQAKNAKPAITSSEDAKGDGDSPAIFISYQWGVQPQVKSLYRKLSQMGYHCWMDIYQMGGGDSLYDKIDKGVRGSSIVLTCITEKYAKSANCRREVSLADALKKPIIPLLLEDTTWPPNGPMSMVFTQLLYINLTDPTVQKGWSGGSFDEMIQKITGYLQKSSANNGSGPSAKSPQNTTPSETKKPEQPAPGHSANQSQSVAIPTQPQASAQTPNSNKPSNPAPSEKKSKSCALL